MSRRSTSSYCGIVLIDCALLAGLRKVAGPLGVRPIDARQRTPGAFGDDSQGALRSPGRRLCPPIASGIVTFGYSSIDGPASWACSCPAMSGPVKGHRCHPAMDRVLTDSCAANTLYRGSELRTIRIIRRNSSRWSNARVPRTQLFASIGGAGMPQLRDVDTL
jgi:hypothetical protein